MSNKVVYILRGMGIGVVLMAVVMTLVPAKMTNTQIKAEAKKLGMVEANEVSKTEEKLNSILGNETKKETETKTEDKIDDKNEDKQNSNTSKAENKEQQDSNSSKTDENTEEKNEEIKMTGPGEDV